MDTQKPGIKTTEAAAAGLAGIATIVPVVLGAVPKEHTWIALVVFGVVASVYISWRSYLKLKSPSGEK